MTLTAILPLLMVWGLTLAISYRSQQRTKQTEQVVISNLIADDFERYILNTEEQLQIFVDTLSRADQPTAISDADLGLLVLSGSAFQEIALYDSAGRRQAGASRATDTMPASIAGTPLFEQAQTGRPAYADPPPLPAGTSLPLSPDEIPRLRIAVSASISVEQRMYLVGAVNIDQLWVITNRAERATSTHLMVLTADGTLVSASRTQLLLSPPAPSELPIFQGEAVQTYPSVLGYEVLGVRTPITPLGWTLVVEQATDTIYQDVDQLALSLFIVIVIALPAVALVGWLAGRSITQPIQLLHQRVESFTRDPLNYQPIAIRTQDELTRLGEAFNTMAGALNESQARLTQANHDLEDEVEARTAELQRAFQEIQAQYEKQEHLLETVRHLGMPVIPITRGMVVMPLVGEFSASRANDISAHLLGAVERAQARVVLLDITGVPTIDQDGASALIKAISAAQLLGTTVILAGIRPDMAETLVNLGLGLDAIRTAATLEQAFLAGMGLLNARQRLQVGGQYYQRS